MTLLEVIALDVQDARNAAAGGAHRLELVSGMHVGGLSPSLDTFRAVRDAVEIPIRVMIRLEGGFSTGGAIAQLCDTAGTLREAGASAFVLGWLDARGGVDGDALRAVLPSLGGCPWTFHRAMDACADRDAAYDAIRGLPGLDSVLTSGGPTLNIDALVAEAARERALGGPQVLAGGGVRAEHVPILRAGGITAFHVGSAARPLAGEAAWSAPVSTDAVRRLCDLLAT